MGTKRLEATLAAITPAAVGYRDDLPYISPEKVAREGVKHVRQGGYDLVLVFKGALFLLNIITVITHGKLLKNMEREKQQRFLEKCARSRFLLIRGIAMLLKIPLAVHYYSQDEVCLALGYSREELCTDADKHQVTR